MKKSQIIMAGIVLVAVIGATALINKVPFVNKLVS